MGSQAQYENNNSETNICQTRVKLVYFQTPPMLYKVLVNVLGVLIFLFIFWKRQKEDFASSEIFSTSFYIIFGALLGAIVSLKLAQSWWFWASFVGSVVAMSLAIVKFRLRVFETIETSVISFLPWLGLVFLVDSVLEKSLTSLLGFVIILALVFMFIYLDLHYKKFTWYKSGKIGFSGLTVLGALFLVRALIALFSSSVLSFSGKFETYLSALVAFLSFFTVFNLAREKL